MKINKYKYKFNLILIQMKISNSGSHKTIKYIKIKNNKIYKKFINLIKYTRIKVNLINIRNRKL